MLSAHLYSVIEMQEEEEEEEIDERTIRIRMKIK